MEAIFKQAKEEQEKADQEYEEQQKNEALNSKKPGVDALLVAKTNALKNPGGRGRKAGKATSLKIGSTVQVTSGAFAGFSGILKKLDTKTGLVIHS